MKGLKIFSDYGYLVEPFSSVELKTTGCKLQTVISPP